MPPKIPYKKINISFKPDDFAKIEYLAKKEGMSKSGYIRFRLSPDFEIDKPRKPKTQTPSLELIRQVKAIGKNLNQITAKVNSTKYVDRLVLIEIAKISETLKKLL